MNNQRYKPVFICLYRWLFMAFIVLFAFKNTRFGIFYHSDCISRRRSCRYGFFALPLKLLPIRADSQFSHSRSVAM